MKRVRSNRGIGLVLSLLVLSVLTVIMGASAVALKALKRESVYQKKVLEAQTIAEAGADDALALLQTDEGWRTGLTNKTFLTGYYTAALSSDPRAVVTVTGYSSPLANLGRAHKAVRFTAESLAIPQMNYAVHTEKDIVIYNTGTRADSYDSSIDPEPSIFGSSATFWANDDLWVASGVTIEGAGHHFDQITDPASFTQGAVDESVKNNVPEYASLDYSSDNDNATGITPASYYNPGNRDLNVPINQTCTIKSGVYHFHKFVIHDNATVNLLITNGPVLIILDDDFDMTNNASQLNNPTKLPANLIVYGLSVQGNGRGVLDPHSTAAPIHGVFLAGIGHVTVHATVYGAVAARDVSWNGNGYLHYDIALQEANRNAVRVVEGSWELADTKL